VEKTNRGKLGAGVTRKKKERTRCILKGLGITAVESMERLGGGRPGKRAYKGKKSGLGCTPDKPEMQRRQRHVESS